MQSSGASPSRSVSGHSQPDNPSSARKPYNPPKFAVLTPDQAEAELQAKGLPGDPGGPVLANLVPKPEQKQLFGSHAEPHP
jgi:hypothetical protein